MTEQEARNETEATLMERVVVTMLSDEQLLKAWDAGVRSGDDGWSTSSRDHVRAGLRAVEAAVLARASQPVQVEVTDDMVERAAIALHEVNGVHASSMSWEPLAEWAKAAYRTDARAALSAALGGGDETVDDSPIAPAPRSARDHAVLQSEQRCQCLCHAMVGFKHVDACCSQTGSLR